MRRENEVRAMEALVARTREAEQRAAQADKQKQKIEQLLARIDADAEKISSLQSDVDLLRAEVAARRVERADLEAASSRIGRLLRRAEEAEQRRDAAVAAEAEAAARCRAAEADLRRTAQDFQRFRNLRWNRLGMVLRRPINGVKAVLRR